MTRSTRVKVSRTALIESIEARRAEAVAAHEKYVAEYDKRYEDYRKAVVAALEAASVKAQTGKGIPDRSYNGALLVPVKMAAPTKPSSKASTAKYDRDIALLKMGTEDTLSLTAEALEAYVR